ncbi:asparagine synthase (glutamine-hydrolyzing) [Ideonella sp. DXS22W]|uniref:asparagine synthase (glutamine-hydrolyzing) n=1 Tax=Pseudaquabacterium inlustre TaxID=2984192 RepID=A0ABU9CDY7_9BURK
MCGIAAIFSYSADAPPVNPDELRQIRDRMAARGPDGAGLWISPDRRAGMAHRRLAIIDLSTDGAQPMHDASLGTSIVFNGEIYNYRQLRAELERDGFQFLSHSDTEVLLKLYARDGERMLSRLRGMFAFAIHDPRSASVFIARDPLGIKPLYLADDGRTLRLASQVKALLASPAIDTREEPAGHVGFFLWGHVPDPFTLFRGIRALPAGACLRVDLTAGRKSQKQYYSLADDLAQAPVPPALQDPRAAQEALAQAMRDSVKHHLVADVPVGVFLSAGLDSTTLAALTREAGNSQLLRTLTLGFEEFVGTPADETGLAQEVALDLGAEHSTRWTRQSDFVGHADKVLHAMDQPSIDGVNTYFVSHAAQQAGLKVALSGLGGDELFAGYSDFQTIPKLVRLAAPLAAIPGLGRGFRYVSAPLLRRVTSPKAAGLIEFGGDFASAYLLRRGFFMPWEIPNELDGDLVREGWESLQTLEQLRLSERALTSPRHRVSALQSSWYMRNQLLRDSDWASMAHSLEVRVPLVDVELIRVVASLVNAGHPPSKLDMAATPSRPLPTSVLERKKTGFSIPVSQWLTERTTSTDRKASGGLRDWGRQVYRQLTAGEHRR